MSAVLKIGEQTITSDQLLPLLSGYQMLPQLVREIVIDQAIAQIECTPQEQALACQKFCEQHQLVTPQQRQNWLSRYGMSDQQLEALAVRLLKVEKFKQNTWGNKLESYFLQRKSKLDQVVYSLLRTKNADIATELYFRIQEEESSFAELAQQYSEGPEAQTGGIVGPVYLHTPHEKIAQMLGASEPGQLWPPVRVGEWHIIVRMEKLIPAQLDNLMRQRLLNELFQTWLEEQIQQVNPSVVLDATTSGASQ